MPLAVIRLSDRAGGAKEPAHEEPMVVLLKWRALKTIKGGALGSLWGLSLDELVQALDDSQQELARLEGWVTSLAEVIRPQLKSSKDKAQ